jgi:16S rRNA (uracil1498-N3)-methyltransferase
MSTPSEIAGMRPNVPVPRLYLDAVIQAGAGIELTGDRARYIGRVLRLRPGDPVTLFDGHDNEFTARIRSAGKSAVLLDVEELTGRSVESPLGVHLLQGISRGERMDFVMQKATELGVERITPIRTEYTVVRLSGARADKRVDHWRGVAASACEQCGRSRLPVVDAIIGLRDWLGDHRAMDDTRIVLAPGAARSVRNLEPTDRRLTVCIGPEGGFSDEEYDLLDATGFVAVGFGPRILRTETAATALLSTLQALFGDCG